jgi:hypothetical protein
MTNPVIRSDGTQIHYENGKWHRIGGPAYIGFTGTQIYFEHDKRHRIGGPAYIGADGTKEYWIDGNEVTELEHDLLYGIMKLKGLMA